VGDKALRQSVTSLLRDVAEKLDNRSHVIDARPRVVLLPVDNAHDIAADPDGGILLDDSEFQATLPDRVTQRFDLDKVGGLPDFYSE